MKTVLVGDLACAIGRAMDPATAAPAALHFLDGTPNQATLDGALAQADVLVSMAYDGRFGAARRLKLLQLPGIGLDHVELKRLPAGVRVAVCRGHEQAVAEYVLASVILCRRRLPAAAASLGAGSWEMSSRAGGPLGAELSGSSALIIGGGGIGRHLAALFCTFGVATVCCTRHPFAAPAGVRIAPRTGLHAELARADTVVLACALDASSHRLIDDAALAAMRSDAWLVNIARGECVDPQALYDACRERRIGGAILDVWYRYPPHAGVRMAPSAYPFETLENVFGTPHVSAWTRQVVQRRAATIAHNLRALARGDALLEELTLPTAQVRA